MISNNTWLGDSGASCHLSKSDKGMFNIKKINSGIKLGNGKSLIATKIGDMERSIVQKDGKRI